MRHITSILLYLISFPCLAAELPYSKEEIRKFYQSIPQEEVESPANDKAKKFYEPSREVKTPDKGQPQDEVDGRSPKVNIEGPKVSGDNAPLVDEYGFPLPKKDNIKIAPSIKDLVTPSSNTVIEKKESLETKEKTPSIEKTPRQIIIEKKKEEKNNNKILIEKKEIKDGDNKITIEKEPIRIIPPEIRVDPPTGISSSRVDSEGKSPKITDRDDSPLRFYRPEDLGIASYRTPKLTNYQKRFLFDLHGGAGANSAASLNAAFAVKISGHTLGVAYERAQWLDPETNTGKFIESQFIDYCGALALEIDWLSIQPCYRYGKGLGFWRERDALNRVVDQQKERSVFKYYGRFILALPIFGPDRVLIEGISGYSEDPFLYGPFYQAWIKTPQFLSIGFESYGEQRNIISIGLSLGAWSID